MDKSEKRAVLSFIIEREVIAYRRIKNNTDYTQICERQKKTDEIVEKFYHERFSDEERLTIRRHYEGETERYSYENHAIYLQGVKDCLLLIGYLGLLAN